MKKELVIFLATLIFFNVFIFSAPLINAANSTYYSTRITSITAGGGNASGGSYRTTLGILPIAGTVNSSVYKVHLGFFLYPRIDVTAPTASLTCSPSSVTPGGTVTCSCVAYDNFDYDLTYSYSLNTAGNSPSVTENTNIVGSYTETCTVTDDAGNNASDNGYFTVYESGGPPPVCTPDCTACSYESGVCDETGVKDCVGGDCSSSQQSCTRDTDGIGCGSGKVCYGGTCSDICTNECSTSGQKSCADSSSYQICGNYDADSCLEWSSAVICNLGEICSGGSCVPSTEFLTVAGGGGGTGCVSKWNCSEFGECSILYDITGEIRSRQTQKCTDLNGCFPSTIRELSCRVEVPIIVERVERCFEKHIMIYNNLTGKLIADLKEDITQKKAGIDVSLATTEIIQDYCDYCYDGEKNFDETYTDCGGSCASCNLNSFTEWMEGEEVDLEFMQNLSKKESILFTIANEEHSITVKEVNESAGTVLLIISSEPFEILLHVPETKEIDFNEDGKNEISITLLSIKEGRPELIVKKLIIEKEIIKAILPGINFPYSQYFGLLLMLILFSFLIIYLMQYFLPQHRKPRFLLSKREQELFEKTERKISSLERFEEKEEAEIERIKRAIIKARGPAYEIRKEKESIKDTEKSIASLRGIDRRREDEVKKLEEELERAKAKRKIEVHRKHGKLAFKFKFPEIKLPKIQFFKKKSIKPVETAIKKEKVILHKEELDIKKLQKEIRKAVPEEKPKISLIRMIRLFIQPKKEFQKEIKKTEKELSAIERVEKKEEKQIREIEHEIKKTEKPVPVHIAPHKKLKWPIIKFKFPKIKLPKIKLPKIKLPKLIKKKPVEHPKQVKKTEEKPHIEITRLIKQEIIPKEKPKAIPEKKAEVSKEEIKKLQKEIAILEKKEKILEREKKPLEIKPIPIKQIPISKPSYEIVPHKKLKWPIFKFPKISLPKIRLFKKESPEKIIKKEKALSEKTEKSLIRLERIEEKEEEKVRRLQERIRKSIPKEKPKITLTRLVSKMIIPKEKPIETKLQPIQQVPIASAKPLPLRSRIKQLKEYAKIEVPRVDNPDMIPFAKPRKERKDKK